MTEPSHHLTDTAVAAQPDVHPDLAGDIAADRLRQALLRHGLALPSLRGATAALGTTPMVELGGCAARLADAIAEILEKAAQR